MVFKVVSEGDSIYCSSPRCIQKLLSEGWSLADPAQSADLSSALESERSGGDPSAECTVCLQ
jgi:hypothetical protein